MHRYQPNIFVFMMAMTISFCGVNATAKCWSDPALINKQATLVSKHFPALSSKLPTIEYCEQSIFGSSVIGDYNPSTHHIRVSHDSGFPLDVLILHEAGHALADMHGEVHGKFAGHNEKWLKTMILGGLSSEASRTAHLTHVYPGLDRLYARVMHELSASRKRPEYEIDIVTFLKQRPAFIDWLMKPID